ncbi:MAG: YgfZ/GcvT domain-containing protein [Solirubrobacteraceae bacterium]
MTVSQTTDNAYRAATETAALFDRSERGKLALSGPDAREFLHGQLTQDIRGLEPGHGTYAAFLTAKGKMLGDLRVLNADGELLLDTERSALQALFNMIRSYKLGYDVQLDKRTLQSGLVSLIGPQADDLLRSAGATAPGPVEHDHLALQLGGFDLRAIRTDLGLDLLCAADDTVPLTDLLTQAGAVLISEPTAECLRIETGRPRYGVDLDDTVIPQEAGLNDRAVSFAKGCYVGQETVARLFYKGKPNRELRGLRSENALTPGSELSLADSGRSVGVVTSATVSPRLGPLALALVRREAPPGTTVDAAGQQALVVALPF